MNKSGLTYYKELLGYKDIPAFLVKYLYTPCLTRLQKIGYFCGMDYASKDIYNFTEYISRYDHSLTTALLTWKYTLNKAATIAALFHDVATPCFSHVIDYMNRDYLLQESTEKYTQAILKSSKYLAMCLKEDNITIEEIIDFKRYSIVDNNRPRLCADRLDGIILTGYGWTKDINKNVIRKILENTEIYLNEDDKEEIGFKTEKIAREVVNYAQNIDIACHSKEDNYMMQLLAIITKIGIESGLYSYQDLFVFDEETLFYFLNKSKKKEISEKLDSFYHIKKEEIPVIDIPQIKARTINPLVKGKRLNHN